MLRELGEFSLPPFFCKTYTITKTYYPGETVNIHIQSLIHIIPTLISEGPQWGMVDLICISVSLSGRLCRFLGIICVACNCAQCMQPQAIGSNTLS